MKNLTRHVPNLLTIGNLLSGVYGIILVMQGDLRAGAYLIWAGALFDFADGFAARILNAWSGIGKELDSLADMVTFGLLPSLLLFNLLNMQLTAPYQYLSFTALLVPVFSALRLAKFNIDTEQKENFKGLPTPANAFLLSGIPFIYNSQILTGGASSLLMIILILAGCILMVSRVNFPSLKFKNLNPGENVARYLIILSVLVLVAAFGMRGITPAITVYIVIALITHFAASGKNATVH
jgi:CDP-diacylglycerol---serine O-phosphatidyltransferase